MKFIIIATIIFSVLAACKKAQYTKASNPKVEILDSLNSGRYQSTIDLADKYLENNPQDEDVLYYRASAYSMKGNLNVYSMYPILEMYLFNLPAKDWGHINRRNPYEDYFFALPDTEKSLTKEEYAKYLDKRWKTIEARYWSINSDYKEEYDCRLFPVSRIQDRSRIDYRCNRCKYYANKKFTYYFNNNRDFTGYYESLTPSEQDDLYGVTRGIKCWEMNNAVNYRIDQYYYVTKNLAWEKKAWYDKRWDAFNNREEDQNVLGLTPEEFNKVLMNSLWGIYESIPTMKMIPNFNDKQIAAHMLSAKDLKRLIRFSKKYLIQGSHQLALQVMVGLIDIVKDSVDLDEVESPLDLLCEMDAKVLVNSYERFLDYIDTLLTISEQVNIINIDKKQIAEIREQMKVLPSNLTPEQKKEFEYDIYYVQADNCEDIIK